MIKNKHWTIGLEFFLKIVIYQKKRFWSFWETFGRTLFIINHRLSLLSLLWTQQLIINFRLIESKVLYYIVSYLWKSYNHLIILKSETLFAHDTLMNKPKTQFAHGYINEGSKYSIWSFNINIYKMMIKANTPFVHLHW